MPDRTIRSGPDPLDDERGEPPRAGRSTLLWGAKGGSGTSVVAAALALDAGGPVVVVDLAADLPAVFGLAEPPGPGVAEWLASDAPADRLEDLAVPVTDRVELIPTGRGEVVGTLTRWDDLVTSLSRHGRHVVIDAGTGPPPAALHERCDRSLLVTRPCYLALRRAVASPTRPSGVVLVTEPGRALRGIDVETAIGAPVVTTVGLDPLVARAVDAGLLSNRLPRSLAREIRHAA